MNDMVKEEDLLNECGHRNSERVGALKEFPSAVCPACLFERIKELEENLDAECRVSQMLLTETKRLKSQAEPIPDEEEP